MASAFPDIKDAARQPWITIRGQSAREPLFESVLSDGSAVPERWRERFIGFRCVKDAR